MLSKFASILVSVFVPFMVMWCVYVTKQIHQLEITMAAFQMYISEQGDKFTTADGRLLAYELKEAMRLMIGEHMDKTHATHDNPTRPKP